MGRYAAMPSLILYLTPGLRPGLRALSLLRSSHYTGNASDIRLCRSFQRYLGHYPADRARCLPLRTCDTFRSLPLSLPRPQPGLEPSRTGEME